MIVLGITGPMASGKSNISRALTQSFKIPVFDGDREVKFLMTKEGVKKKILSMDPNLSSVSKKDIWSWIQKNTDNLYKMEMVLHPLVLSRLGVFINFHRNIKTPVIAIDIPLLFECGWDTLCDYVVLTDVRCDLQMKRLRERGYRDKEISILLGRMLPITYKKTHADFVISSNVGFRYAFEKLKEILDLYAPNRSRY